MDDNTDNQKIIEDSSINRSPNAGNNSAAEQGVEIPSGWKPTMAKPVPVVRCNYVFPAHHAKAGERCSKWSIAGHIKCVKHGGQIPNVKKHAAAVVESARMRLLGMSDEAIDVLGDLIKPGTGDQIRLGAVKEILDRAGIVKQAPDIQVEVNHRVDPAQVISDRLKAMRDRIEAPEDEIVDEDEIKE